MNNTKEFILILTVKKTIIITRINSILIFKFLYVCINIKAASKIKINAESVNNKGKTYTVGKIHNTKAIRFHKFIHI